MVVWCSVAAACEIAALNPGGIVAAAAIDRKGKAAQRNEIEHIMMFSTIPETERLSALGCPNNMTNCNFEMRPTADRWTVLSRANEHH